jgi:hypothetical protein
VSQLAEALRDQVRELAGALFPHAVIGGLSVSARTEPRFTRDVDLAVAVEDDRAAERFVNGLLRHGWRILAHLEQTSTHRLATIRAIRPGSDGVVGVVVDFLLASSGLEQEVARDADRIEVFDGVVAPVASAVHLLAMKVLSMDEVSRPQDRTDALALLATLTPDQIEEVRAALRDLEARGFHRDKDLQGELDGLLAR